MKLAVIAILASLTGGQGGDEDRNILSDPGAVARLTMTRIKMDTGWSSDISMASGALHRVNGRRYICGTLTYGDEAPQRFVSPWGHQGSAGRENYGPPALRSMFENLYAAKCTPESKVGDLDW